LRTEGGERVARTTSYTILFVVGGLCSTWSVGAQTRAALTVSADSATRSRRPIPGAVYESAGFTRAVANGTRTRSGEPGPRYWTQHPRYSIEATLAPATNTLTGSERVVYVNDSPDTLARLMVHLRQNVFRAESPRRDDAPLTSGMTLKRVAVDGVALAERQNGEPSRSGGSAAGYAVRATVMEIALAAPLLPHDSVTLELAWSYVPALTPSDGRQGRDDHVYFMGYWYPQIAVYDDVSGWVADPYLLEAEFYMDHADYDVRVTVPHGWAVGATGTLQNSNAVLSAAARAKLAQARSSGSILTISKPGDGGAAFAPSARAVTWHFTARNVRDFAWGTSDRYAWDATRALVKNASGVLDTVDINSFYRLEPRAAAWALGGARYTRDAIEKLSDYLWKYPWPSMTSMEGILTDGGMEYPRLTVMQPWADTLSLAGDLMHETGHMWFPMQVGSNENHYPWMDEGFTQYDEAQGMRMLYGEPRQGGRIGDSETDQRTLYLQRVAAGQDQSLMTPGDLFPSDLYNVMYYDKTAQVLAALRGVLGEETFHRAFREYGRRWSGKHPYPYDFFNTIDDVAKQKLSWFWTSWFFEAWHLDQAIAGVKADRDSLAITIEDRGLAPMPVTLAVTRADGRVERINIPVDVWLRGARTYVARVARTPEVVKVQIDPEALFPDANRGNQLWMKR
jgi:Peptidase family M1 domain